MGHLLSAHGNALSGDSSAGNSRFLNHHQNKPNPVYSDVSWIIWQTRRSIKISRKVGEKEPATNLLQENPILSSNTSKRLLCCLANKHCIKTQQKTKSCRKQNLKKTRGFNPNFKKFKAFLHVVHKSGIQVLIIQP